MSLGAARALGVALALGAAAREAPSPPAGPRELEGWETPDPVMMWMLTMLPLPLTLRPERAEQISLSLESPASERPLPDRAMQKGDGC